MFLLVDIYSWFYLFCIFLRDWIILDFQRKHGTGRNRNPVVPHENGNTRELFLPLKLERDGNGFLFFNEKG